MFALEQSILRPTDGPLGHLAQGRLKHGHAGSMTEVRPTVSPGAPVHGRVAQTVPYVAPQLLKSSVIGGFGKLASLRHGRLCVEPYL